MEYDSLMKVESLEEDTTLFFAWNSQRFTVKPGGVAMVPFDALRVSLGDPRSGPERIRIGTSDGAPGYVIPSRHEEIQRLNVLYGTYTDGVDDPSYVEHTNGETLRQRLPKVRVTNVGDENEEVVVWPADDPLCERFTPEDADKSQMAVLTRQLDSLRRKTLVMEQIIKASNSEEVAESMGLNNPEVTEDEPVQETHQRRRAN